VVVIAFTVDGDSRGKGRPRLAPGGRAYTDAKTRAYETAIGYAARAAMRGREPLGDLVAVDLVVRLQPPARIPKARRAALVADSEPIRGRSDLDNIAKAILEGVNGIAFADDRQVVALTARQVAAEIAGVDVTIAPYGA
jgi:Holliday junction resolvase RusA-like endonuclease